MVKINYREGIHLLGSNPVSRSTPFIFYISDLTYLFMISVLHPPPHPPLKLLKNFPNFPPQNDF